MTDAPSPFVAMKERLHRAMLTLRSMSSRGIGPAEVRIMWPETITEFGDVVSQEQGPENETGVERSKRKHLASQAALRRMARFVPTSRDVDDYIPALDLLRGSREFHTAFKILAIRAVLEWEAGAGLTVGGWMFVAERVGGSHERARRLHREAIEHAMKADRAIQRRAA